ncbi:MAG: glycosyltransferase [Oscillospiraceae bacterium]|jgi:glycosyltransferase involved in cell wall biosynthesis|nr:glycosyltransferase [Oscillospiraceae bacterium]
MDLISIIIPVYNVEAYLARCLDSVICQSYTNLQIIVADDGSTDNSGAIADEFAARDTRITVIHQPNAGVSAARNAALAVAGGEFIGFVDGDDYIDPDYFEVLHREITGGDYDLAVVGFETVAYGSENARQAGARSALGSVIELPRREVFRRMRVNSIGGFVWNKLFRRSIISAHNLIFDTRIKIAEDLIFLCQYTCFVDTAVYNTSPLYHYVTRQGSIVHKTDLNIEILSTRALVTELQTEIFKEQCPEHLPLIACAHAAYCLALLAIAYKSRGDLARSHEYSRDGKRIFREILSEKIVPSSNKLKLFIKLYLPALHTFIRRYRK